jgi:hypothetical protein
LDIALKLSNRAITINPRYCPTIYIFVVCNMSVAQLVYAYIQSAEAIKQIEIACGSREGEVQVLLAQYDVQDALAVKSDALEMADSEATAAKEALAIQSNELQRLIQVNSDLEKNSHKLIGELQGVRKSQQQNSQTIGEKRMLEKNLTDSKSQLEQEKKIVARLEKDRSELQQTEKKLKSEITELKAQLNRQAMLTDKATREQEKLKSQFASQKSVLESKVESLKVKVAKNNGASPIRSPSRPLSFSPMKSKSAAPSKSLFSTTPFLQKTNKTLANTRADSVIDDNGNTTPAKKATISTASNEDENLSKPVSSSKTNPESNVVDETSFTAITKKDNKKISLFDSDDETPLFNSDKKDKPRKRKLKVSVDTTNLFDEDDPDNPGSQFKRITPRTSMGALKKEISPLKRRNEGMRNIFRV